MKFFEWVLAEHNKDIENDTGIVAVCPDIISQGTAGDHEEITFGLPLGTLQNRKMICLALDEESFKLWQLLNQTN